MKRRKFLSIVGNSATGLVTFGALAVTIDFLSPNVIKERPPKFKVGPIQNIQPDTFIYEPEYRVFVVRDGNGAFYAISAICTHLGCNVKWIDSNIRNDSSVAIACPCHGSKFNRKGEVIEGPAPKGLQRFRIKLSDDDLIVDTSDIVSEEEMYLKV
ncbi:MAG: hypothetical protein A2X61_02875 [Ignavibacteria bacterium GWB2_35_12]|nr:MAG: hypothetical protein A2X63_11680 [Ignavibacteria bacterium GWA2_35_8]OGU38309.1 MAG: hypothetical protein A2X61_02875 [Ignavibacteria bacterium GWB2_35_12]OGU95508.1 MAG: hypothetical protein A2220_07050 [Ignavibacteria bacterium RIFOXYA2_FULL_35_10]OGV20852.1 MAG: hypothetical protein A2475_11675 [Ignavibacteria bacterium RIFOXYC2_FULL_35_21]